MKTSFTCLVLLFASCFPAFSQQAPGPVLASLQTVGELTAPESIKAGSDKVQSIYSFRPVTVLYKQSLWNLTVVDSPEEKQVLHFTDEQLKTIAAIIEARDGKTHYLEITNFFEVYVGQEQAEINEAFLSNMETAIQQKRWFKNNSIFMISVSTVNEEPVVRYKLPFYNDRRVCRHTKARFNLQEDYFETSPERFMRFLTSDPRSLPNNKN